MIVQRTFAVLGNKEQVKATLRVPKRVSARHGATHSDPVSQAVGPAAPTHGRNCLGRGQGRLVDKDARAPHA